MARPKRDVNASPQRVDEILSANAQSEGEVVVARPARPPVIATRYKLSVPGLDTENFHYHWFNDVDENIANRLEEGYVFVNKDKKQVGDRTAYDSQSTSSLIVKSVGLGTKAFLMCIPIELHRERQRSLSQADADEREDYIKNRMKKEKGFRGDITVGNKLVR